MYIYVVYLKNISIECGMPVWHNIKVSQCQLRELGGMKLTTPYLADTGRIAGRGRNQAVSRWG
jgi:hypothetical protein